MKIEKGQESLYKQYLTVLIIQYSLSKSRAWDGTNYKASLFFPNFTRFFKIHAQNHCQIVQKIVTALLHRAIMK